MKAIFVILRFFKLQIGALIPDALLHFSKSCLELFINFINVDFTVFVQALFEMVFEYRFNSIENFVNAWHGIEVHLDILGPELAVCAELSVEILLLLLFTSKLEQIGSLAAQLGGWS